MANHDRIVQNFQSSNGKLENCRSISKATLDNVPMGVVMINSSEMGGSFATL